MVVSDGAKKCEILKRLIDMSMIAGYSLAFFEVFLNQGAIVELANKLAIVVDVIFAVSAHAGNSCKSEYTTIPQLKEESLVLVDDKKGFQAYVGKVAQTVSRVNIVGPMPAIAMSLVRMFPTPATMALGGVPT